MYGSVLKLVNDQTGRDALAVDFLQEPFLGPQIFTIPLASKRYVLGGDNIFRDGADLVASKRENAGLQIQTGFQECDFEKLMDLKAKMERLCEQARLRSHRGWGPKVELQWRPEGKYYIRYADILDGDLDMPMNWLQMESPQHTVKPEDCILSLIRKPHWREDEETLENWIENPSFLLTQGGYVYEPAFGFDCWDSAGGAVAGVDTINWVQGGQSIHVTDPATAGWEGINTDLIPLIGGIWYYVEAWVWHRAGDPVTGWMRRETGAILVTPVARWTAVDTPVIDEQSKHVDAAWREPGFIRKGFVFQAPATDDYRFFLSVWPGDATGAALEFNADRVYLTEAANLNWTVEADRVLDPTDDWKEIYLMPRAWCSGREITPHVDVGDCVHGGETPGLPGYENHISYLDVEDIPGNLETPMDLEAQLMQFGKDVNSPNMWHDWYVGRRTRENLIRFVYAYNAVNLANLGATFALAADAYVPDCWRAQSALGPGADTIWWNITNLLDQHGTYRVYIIAKTTTAPTVITANFGLRIGQYWTQQGDNIPLEFSNSAYYRIMDLGLLDIPGTAPPPLPWDEVTSPPRLSLSFLKTAGASVYLGGLILMPADEELLLVSSGYGILQPSLGGIMAHQIDEREGIHHITTTREIYSIMGYLGAPVSLRPKIWNRLVNLMSLMDSGLDEGFFSPAMVTHLRLRYQPRFL